MSTENTTRGARKVRKGVVVSKSGAKTVKVRVSYREIHPVYGKVVTRNKNYPEADYPLWQILWSVSSCNRVRKG